ncbi:hypothetical protein ACLBYN_18600, partial [Pseudomonas aeruginosa]
SRPAPRARLSGGWAKGWSVIARPSLLEISPVLADFMPTNFGKITETSCNQWFCRDRDKQPPTHPDAPL